VNADAVFERACRRFSDAPCWCDASGSLSFAEAQKLVAKLAGGLAGLGLEPGDRLALVGSDSNRLLALIAASWRIGVLPCLLDPRLAAGEAMQLLERIQPRLVLHSTGLDWHGASRELDDPDLEGEPLTRGCHGNESPLFCSATSGTTGPPKLAVLQSGPVTLATAFIAERARLAPRDFLVATTPTSSSFQLVSAMLPALHVGAAVVLVAGRGAAGVREAVAEGMGSVLLGYPMTLGDVGAEPPPQGLRLAISGGSPLPPRLKREYRDRLGFPLIESYGMSELGGFAALGRPGDEGAAIGRPLPDRPVEAFDPAGEKVDAGTPGEVVVLEGWMAGYLGDDRATAAATRGGVLHTSDVGVFDADGNLTLLGRLSDQPLAERLGGHLRRCEDVLHDHPRVLHAAAVFGDGRLAAYVQARPGASLDPLELTAYAAACLPAGLVPASVTTVAALPRTFSGKLDRRAVARL
jgi:long-chain acyl-CoA synthetase